MSNYKNSRAQVGETASWVVATLVILGILILFIYLSVLFSKTKIISVNSAESDFAKDAYSISVKNNLAFQVSDNQNKDLILNILSEENKNVQ